MFRQFFQYAIHRIAGLRQDCQGFVVMSTLAIFLFLFLLCAFVYAVGETIHQRIKMQNACDAAAYSAAVVQADGLSRMAVVNRAMAWSYVQMTNRQMDYITYRWLKLTCKRFNEDKENAKKYAKDAQLLAFCDPESGFFALLEMAASAAVIRVLKHTGIVDFYCAKGNHGPSHEGWTWWCGVPNISGGDYKVHLNIDPTLSWTNFGNAVLSSNIVTTNLIKTALRPIGTIFDKGNQDKPEEWGYYLGEWIDYDKKNIYRMNKALNRINRQMTISMRMTAESVLKSMLKDNRIDAKNVLKDYYISIHIPEAEDPYKDMERSDSVPKSYFSPLRNTEADEMLFLNMQSANNSGGSLHSHFKTLGDGDLAYGLDQWFIRGKGNYSDRRNEDDQKDEPACYLKQDSNSYRGNVSGHVDEGSKVILTSTVRDEGKLGISRVYKDANLNETKAGILMLGRKKVDRGNHVFNFNTAHSNTSSSNLFSMVSQIFGASLSYLAQATVDIQASAGNYKNANRNYYGMCSKVSDTYGLYADYEWASAKWVCLSSLLAYTYTTITLHEDLKKIWCDAALQEKTWKTRIRGPVGRYFKARWLKSYGYGHWAFPKHFCGSRKQGVSNSIPGIAGALIPAVFNERVGEPYHGYMQNTLDLLEMVKPMKPFVSGSGFNLKRDEYNSCAIGIRMPPPNPLLGESCPAAFLQGYSRIYGDDKEIFDNRYVGARCKPWVLNERFFAGDGTIIVGAAMKHTNPLVQLFNFWNTKAEGDENNKNFTTGQETQENAERTVLSAFNIPKNNYMWTMSAARAGVCHRRRAGAFDQARQYQITYDSTGDAENLAYNSGPYVMTEDGHWTTPDAWGGSHPDNPHALSRIHRPAGESQQHVPIWNGCPCSGNAAQFRNLWNLCETDWDATLIPVRYAGQKAKLFLGEGSGGNLEGLPFNGSNYEERRRLIGIHITNPDNYSFTNGQNDKEKNDMAIGNGKNWVWNGIVNNTSTLLTNNPFIHANWKPAGNDYFSKENLFYSLIPDEISTGISMLKGLNLNSKIPTGKEEKTINVFTIFRDKVL